MVIKVKTDDMGLNAATRTFDFAKNTILSWERKFSYLHRVLFLYTLVHKFLEFVIEGDEAYTKVHHNVPPYESPGWTILLMGRAIRLIWKLDCSPKDRKLFKKDIATLEQIVSRTHDLSLLTDGERRCGTLLFEVCYEWVKNGKRGRPKKTLTRGVGVRMKNQGLPAHQKGGKRLKYQSPWAEYPETKSIFSVIGQRLVGKYRFILPYDGKDALRFVARTVMAPSRPSARPLARNSDSHWLGLQTGYGDAATCCPRANCFVGRGGEFRVI